MADAIGLGNHCSIHTELRERCHFAPIMLHSSERSRSRTETLRCYKFEDLNR